MGYFELLNGFRKTVLRQLISKWGIMSIQLQEAFTKDMAVMKDNGDYEYVDSPTYEEEPVFVKKEDKKTAKSLDDIN